MPEQLKWEKEQQQQQTEGALKAPRVSGPLGRAADSPEPVLLEPESGLHHYLLVAEASHQALAAGSPEVDTDSHEASDSLADNQEVVRSLEAAHIQADSRSLEVVAHILADNPASDTLEAAVRIPADSLAVDTLGGNPAAAVARQKEVGEAGFRLVEEYRS